MIKIEYKMKCSGCAACAAICPKQCITMRSDEEGFFYPEIDSSTCIHCNRCEQVCPIIQTRVLQEPNVLKSPVAYAAYNLDESTRLSSSSGGMFTLLAEKVLQEKGIVFGAAMSEDQHSVSHIAVENVEDLEKLRGSKYLQSNTDGVYPKVSEELETGRRVLFSGTPCQVEALHTFLGREYENLLCVDLICHGVPSPKVWDKYISYQEDRAGAPARRTFSRHKKYGWKTFAVLFEFSNNTAYEQILSKDLFMQAFLQNACLRPSCHSCAFKKLNRLSDITLADFWGIQDIAPEMDDDKGTSLVIVHTAKGQKVFDSLKNEMRFLEVEIAKALAGNPAMTASVPEHKCRRQFFAHLDTMPFDVLVKKYAKPQRSWKGTLVSLLQKTGLYVPVRRVIKRVKGQPQ